jgi:hypothetical protein
MVVGVVAAINSGCARLRGGRWVCEPRFRLEQV